MEFNENKFEEMSHWHTRDIREGTYKMMSGKDIKPKHAMKDLGVLIRKELPFKENINDIAQSSKVR